jgi:hypothetical protein
MTEQEWLAGTEPDDLLEFVRDRASDRQFRLFMAACCRRFLPLMPKMPAGDLRLCEKAVDYAERFADGLITRDELSAAFDAMDWVNVTNDGYLASVAARKLTYVEIAGCPRPMLRGRNLIAHPASEAAEYSRDVVSRLQQQSKTARGTTPAAKKRLAIIAEKRYQIGLLHDLFGNPFRPLPLAQGENARLKQWRRSLAWKGATVPNLAQTIYDERQFDRLTILADALEQAGCTEAEILNHCREPGPHVRGCWVVDLVLNKYIWQRSGE